MTEDMRRYSPYNYGFNNPVRFVDPDGMISLDAIKVDRKNEDYVFREDDLFNNDRRNYIAGVPVRPGRNAVNTAGTIVRKNKSGYSISQVKGGDGGFGIGDIMELGFGFTPVGTGLDIISGFTGETVSGESLSWGWRLAGLIPMVSELRKGTKIISLVKKDSKLLKLAKETFEGNDLLRKEANGLIEQLSHGNTNPGLGTKHIGSNIFEARSRGGARVYFRNAGNGIEIVGYSHKGNQTQVINQILKIH